MKQKISLIVLFFFIPLVFLYAEEEIFAPFVSRIKVVPEESRVKLTWVDSQDVTGKYHIYRHTEEITEDTFRLADRVGQASSGQEYYFDAPPEYGTPYYYAVLAESEEGELFELFIPFRNKTIYAVTLQETPETTYTAARVTSLQPKVLEDHILLQYTVDIKGRELSIYRGVSPILEAEDVLNAELIAMVSSSDGEYRDFTIPGVPYYYGIIDSELLKAGIYTFEEGKNSTTVSVEIPLSREIIRQPAVVTRPKPLPVLTLQTTLLTGEDLAYPPMPFGTKTSLSEDIQLILDRLTKATGTEAETPQGAELLETDRLKLDQRESYSLGRILSTTFPSGKWNEAEQQLLLFQRTRHEGDDDLRSHFYLGQAYFFQKKYREALYQFLLTRETYRLETDSWLDAVLKALG
ncbi:MAG: hypothetical protein JW760_11225 [Spirochaetales bacterium]|nr:hypothetical protein [Spirochaetales bacterium]